MKQSLLSLAVAASLLSGCSLIPDYPSSDAQVQAQWPQGAAYGDSADNSQGNASAILWQDFFQDAALKQLIELALENNRDLKVAALNVEAYRSQYRIQRSELFPSLSADGQGSRQRIPGAMNASGDPTINSQYSATVGVNAWELDFFGRINSLSEQALQTFFATEQAARSTQISLIASVANAYLQWQADLALLELSQETFSTYENTLRLTQRSFDVGVVDALTLTQAQTAADSARVNLSRYQRAVAQDRNALAVLLGTQLPESLPQALDVDSELLQALPAGLPSDLLQRRPDLLQAEHQLRAANASIGAARAAFFPRISLTANAGSLSNDLGDLFDGGSGTWLFQPRISLPIFTAGRLSANLDYAELQKDIRVAQYEKAIQVAFREVADRLAARFTYAEQVKAQRTLADASQRYYDLADRRYQNGVDSFLTLLDAQRQLFAARQQLIADRLAQLNTEVELYKALGGGWSQEPTPSEG